MPLVLPDRPPPPRLTARGLLLTAAGYLVAGLLYAGTIVLVSLPYSDDPSGTILNTLGRVGLDYGLKGLLTLPAWWIAVRLLDGRGWGLQIASHLVLAPLWTAAFFGGYYALTQALGMGGLQGVGRVWDVYIPLLFYLVQFGAFHAARYVRLVTWRAERETALAQHAAELAERARVAESAALKAQIQPHFLFNTLNAITASVPPEQEATRTLIARLADLLRYALRASQRDTVRLGEELAMVRAYLALEGERLGDRLDYAVEATPDVAELSVAPLLIQPLVENAVRHGISPLVDGGTVRVSARRTADGVVVEVADTGVGLAGGDGAPPADALEGHGIGLANTSARLRALYGASLQVTPNTPSGTRVVFTLPLPQPAPAA